MKENTTVFVVDDDEIVCESLKWLISSIDIPVETYTSPTEFLSTFDGSRSGCLVLDVRMPEMSGLELMKKLNERDVYLPTIMMTAHGDVPMAVRAMKSGALDFVQKPFNEQELLESVQKALSVDERTRRARTLAVDVKERLNTLSPREREVLALVVEGISNKEIAKRLDISYRTVEVHRAKVMDKMGVDSLPELVRSVIALEQLELAAGLPAAAG
ncbi:response regulator transcription factor [Endothiovibrio diazotrophicus]